MHLAPNMYKMVTVKANAKEIITLKCIWHQICTQTVHKMQTDVTDCYYSDHDFILCAMTV